MIILDIIRTNEIISGYVTLRGGAPARRHMKYGGYMQNNILIKENMLKKHLFSISSPGLL